MSSRPLEAVGPVGAKGVDLIPMKIVLVDYESRVAGRIERKRELAVIMDKAEENRDGNKLPRVYLLRNLEPFAASEWLEEQILLKAQESSDGLKLASI